MVTHCYARIIACMSTPLDVAYRIGAEQAIKEASLISMKYQHVLDRLTSSLPPGPRLVAHEDDIGHRLFDRFFLKRAPAEEATKSLNDILMEMTRKHPRGLPLPSFHIPIMGPSTVAGGERTPILTLVASRVGDRHEFSTVRAPHMGVRSDSRLNLLDMGDTLLEKIPDQGREDLKNIKRIIRTEWVPRFLDPSNLLQKQP